MSPYFLQKPSIKSMSLRTIGCVGAKMNTHIVQHIHYDYHENLSQLSIPPHCFASPIVTDFFFEEHFHYVISLIIFSTNIKHQHITNFQVLFIPIINLLWDEKLRDAWLFVSPIVFFFVKLYKFEDTTE